MPQIEISNEAVDLVKTCSDLSRRFKDTSVPSRPGFVRINLSWDTIEGLRRLRKDDESLSDIIIELCRSHLNKPAH